MDRIAGLMALILWVAAGAPMASAAPSIEWDPSKPAVRVNGLPREFLERLEANPPKSPKDWEDIFAVRVEPANVLNAIGLPAILGRYVVTDQVLEFLPRFPFEPGLSYRAFFYPEGAKGPMVSSLWRAPRPEVARETVVSQIYPSAPVLPQNLLKFYLQFSGPMQGGHIYENIQLRDDTGALVELPFLEIDEELWNPEMTRLTLFLDPGRIKRGVRPLEEVGPALYPGKSYTLTILEGWLDARGAPLKIPARKEFRVVPPDREAPDPADWKLDAPEAGTRTSAVLTFSDPMDHALALRMITMLDAEGKVMAGRKSLDQNETVWRFEPDQPWKRGRYEIRVESIIEDLAGNNIGKLFEVDLEDAGQRNRHQYPAKTVSLALEVK